MKDIKYFVIYLALSTLSVISCSVEPMNETSSQNISFDVLLSDTPGTKAKSIDLFSEGGRVTSFTLEQVPETKSVQINHSTTFTEIYDTFQVEGREHGTQVFYDNAVYNASTGLWELQDPNNQYLWKPGKEIEIVAAATGMGETATDAFFSGVTYNGSPSTATFNYTLPEHSSQQDFLVGYYRGVVDNGTVGLKFNHPLTSLVFEVGELPLGVTLQVNSITLEGIDASATCDVSFGENTTYSWRAYDGTINYAQMIENPQELNPGDDILDETASFIVIPRSFPYNSEARILLNITENGRTYDMYAPLAGQVWNPGETNIYKISYHGERRPVLCDGPAFNNALASLMGYTITNFSFPNNTTKQYRRINDVTKIVFQTKSDNTEGILVNAPGEKPIYMKRNGNTITVTTDDFIFYTGESVNSMFEGCFYLKSIEGLDKINTADAVSMFHTFSYCASLTSIDLHNFNTSKVENMNSMFRGCRSLVSLDVSSFDTDSLVNGAEMFSSCVSLRNIYFGDHFQCINNTHYGQMFMGCQSLTDLDLSFILGSEEASNIGVMFSCCVNLKTINIENLRGPIRTLWETFSWCFNLESIIFGSNQTLEEVTDMRGTFSRTAETSQLCSITCTEAARDVISSHTNVMQMNLQRFTWNIISQTP